MYLNSKIRNSALPIVLMGSIAIHPCSALAQNNSDGASQIEEIIVTARKKEESMQDIPISVTTLDASAIQENGYLSSLDIDDQVPNLEIKTFGGQPNIFIRGVGNNDFNATTVSPVSVYSDGVLLGLTGSQITQMFDMDRIEVLRGPQGTLFGRNTTGGAIALHSKMPGESFDGYVRTLYGRHDQLEFEGGVSLPVVKDRLAMRLSGIYRERDGDRKNLFNGNDANDIDTKAIRTITRYTPGSNFEALINFHWGEDRSDFQQGKPEGTFPGGTDAFGYSDPVPGDWETLNFNGESRRHIDQIGTSLTLNWELESFSIKSITSFEDVETEYCGDFDHSPNVLDEICFLTDGGQISQEFNFTSNSSDKLEWIAGVYLLFENIDYVTQANLFGDLPAPFSLPLDASSKRDSTTAAIFTELTYHVNDRLSMTGGVRYTYDDKEAHLQSAVVPNLFDPNTPNGSPIFLVPFTELSDNWDALSGRIMVDYELMDDVLIYASFSRGFKSGGFNLGSFFDPNEVTVVTPEFLNAYELGLKSTLLDRRLRFNASGFYYDYSDLQVFTFVAGSSPATPLVFALENAADAEIYGLETEITALPVQGLELNIGLGVLKSKYKNFTSLVGGDLSGNRLPGAPEINLLLAGKYTFSVNNNFLMSVRGEYTYTSKRYFNPFESDLISSRDGYDLFNARVTLEPTNSNWQLALWGKNLADEEYIVDSTDLSGTFGFIPQFFGDRRSYGIELTYNFN